MSASSKKPIRVAVIESARLPFRELNLQSGRLPNIEVVSSNLAELGSRKDIDIILLGISLSKDMFDLLTGIRSMRPDLRIILTGSGIDDEMILKFLASGVRGYLDETAPTTEFIRAVRTVHMRSVWMPKRILSIFVKRLSYGRL